MLCPPLSCCQRRPAGAASTQVYHLARLLLARDGYELLPGERPWMEARTEQLSQGLCQWVLERYLIAGPRALLLIQRVVGSLLQRHCCRRSLRQAVPLRVALGPAVLLDWGIEATETRTSWDELGHCAGDA